MSLGKTLYVGVLCAHKICRSSYTPSPYLEIEDKTLFEVTKTAKAGAKYNESIEIVIETKRLRYAKPHHAMQTILYTTS